ncbi:MAG: ABC transporter permease [Nocardioides sp.]|uniref:ABC transporter permease n=1 Tax=Nocardioides sp. TaxID=35761 RepID=UPI003F0AC76C
MRANIVSEFRKVTATSLWWILALGIAGYMAFIAAALGFGAGTPVDEGGLAVPGADPAAVATSIYGLAPTLGYVFPLVMGALAITTEYRHRTISATFLAEPRRGRVLAAKLIVQCGLGALYGLLGTAAAVGVGALVLNVVDVDPMLGSSEVWTAIGMSVVALAVWGMVGVGFGTLVPNQVASIVLILAFTQFLEPMVRVGLTLVDALAPVAKFLPGAAAEAMVGSSLYSTSAGLDLLERWQGSLVMLAYVVVFAVIGNYLTLRRDVS